MIIEEKQFSMTVFLYQSSVNQICGTHSPNREVSALICRTYKAALAAQ